MITWMTRASMLDTAEDLENETLIQTSRDALALLMSMLGKTDLTPEQVVASSMWAMHEPALAAYICALDIELNSRGFSAINHLGARRLISELRRTEDAEFVRPAWISDIDVLQSHRSNLVRLYPDLYGDLWAGVPELWPYLVPIVAEDGTYMLRVSRAERDMLGTGERQLPTKTSKRVVNL